MLDVSANQGTFSRCIRLLIADRQPIVLHGLTSLFAAQRDFEIVASCSSGTGCLEAIRNLAPDVALLSHTLPDLPVPELLGIARAENLSTRLVFFTEPESDDVLAAAIATGACDAISKYASPDTMLRSLRLMTARGSTSMRRSHDLSAQNANVDGVKVEHMLGMLTHRERQIARLVCHGLSNKEIARELNVSRGTVKVHLHNIFQKLEISNRTVLATIASLQRSSGFSTLALAALAFAILSEAKAAAASNADHDGTAYKDFDESVFEPWKKVILRQIIFADPGETVVLAQKGSPNKLSQITHAAATVEELHAAEQAVLSNFGRGYAPIGSGTPQLPVSPPQAFYRQPGSPMQQIPPLEFASNATAGYGGYGTFAMTAAGVLAYTLENSNAAMLALDPVETPIDSSEVAPSHGTTQVATITIDRAFGVGGNDVDNLAPGMVGHDSHAPLAPASLGHDSARGEGNAGQASAGDDPLNCSGLVDAIDGASGNDRVEGNGGDDTLHGRSGSDTFNGGNDASIGGYGGDQLTGSNGDDTPVYLSANDSNSTQFDTTFDFTSGRDKINLAAFGALAFLHLTSTSTSVPPHTLAWIYNPTNNETIIYVNPTDHSLDIGDPGLLEIHLQGVVSVAESDFVCEPKAAFVAAALEGIDAALVAGTASDGSGLTTGSAHESIDAEPNGSTATAAAWTMPADDGLRFHFERDRVGSIASTKLARFGDGSAYATVDTNDGTVAVPVHVSSIETGDLLGNSAGQGQQVSRSTPERSSVAAELTQPGVTLWHGDSDHLAHSASASANGPAEPVETDDAPGNSAGHGNTQHASRSAAAKPSAADEPAEPGVSAGHGHSPPPHSASAGANGPADPVETDKAPGNSAGHGNTQHASRSAAKPSAADEPAEPGVSAGHGHLPPPHSAAASANGPAVETDNASGNSAGHGNAQHASRSAAAKPSAADEPAEPGVSTGHGHSPPPHSASAGANGPADPVETDNASGNSAGHGNAQHASRSAAAKPSAADEPAEPGVSAGHGHSPPPHSASASANGPAELVETDNASGNNAGHGNTQHASRSAAAKPSAADEPAELAYWTGGTGQEPAFHFKNQGDPPTPIEVVDLEQLNERPFHPGHAAGLAAMPQVGPTAMEEHASSHGNSGQQHASGHLPHELLI